MAKTSGENRTTLATPVRNAGVALVVVAALVLPVLSGCFGKAGRPAEASCDAQIPPDDRALAKAAEDAYWRGEYDRNRPVPPKEYQVFPKPPRDNRFSEFDEERFMGLDSQPALPSLPGDRSLAGPPASFSAPPPFGSDRGKISAPAMGGGLPAAPPDAARPAGIQTGNHFYPVEQLVYGGDYPDIDKPELYRLMPKDVITITVKDHPEFSGQMEIQPDGTVRIPNAPDLVRLRGMTTEEAANELKNTLAVYIKGECKVRVQANRARGGYYYVLGDVLQPGRFPMGLEPIRLSEAVLAANWEANPARRDLDGDELGPSFPAASPRGRFIAPNSADLAKVTLVTPHRSQPVRTTHDARAALMGMTGDDPLIRPGQIVIVPSLDQARNRQLGIEPPDGLLPGKGFSGANSPARLPEVNPVARPAASGPHEVVTVKEGNMAAAFDDNINTSAAKLGPPAETVVEYVAPHDGDARRQRMAGERRDRSRGWKMGL